MISPELGQSPENLIGQPAESVVLEIAKHNPQIFHFSFAWYEPKGPPDRTDLFDSIEKKFILKGKLHELLKENNGNKAIGLVSKVTLLDPNEDYRHRTIQGFAHIPMIDFSCEPTQENVDVCKELLRTHFEEKHGYILKSGRSFHYYGLNLLTEREWTWFMGRCLLLNRPKEGKIMVGDRWIGISLAKWDKQTCGNMYTTLRLSVTQNKPNIPTVVDVF